MLFSLVENLIWNGKGLIMEFSKGMSQGKKKIWDKISETLILESNFYP